jgi:hypothetical protein
VQNRPFRFQESGLLRQKRGAYELYLADNFLLFAFYRGNSSAAATAATTTFN